MVTYKVLITETLRKSVTVAAGSSIEAVEMAKDKYYREETVLSADDYFETEYEPIIISGHDTD